MDTKTESSSGEHLAIAGANPRCPMIEFVHLVSGKWAIPILYRLLVSGGPMRFKDLQRAVAPITQKELTKQLRLFEAKGLVRRHAYMEMPLRVEYEATELGHTMRGALDGLAGWIEEHGPGLRNN